MCVDVQYKYRHGNQYADIFKSSVKVNALFKEAEELLFLGALEEP